MPLLLALGGVQEDVLHVANLALEVFAPHVLLLLELAEHPPLLPQHLHHPRTVAVQPLLVKQEFGWKRTRGDEALQDLKPAQDSAFLDSDVPLPGQLQSRDLSGQGPLSCPHCPPRGLAWEWTQISGRPI